MRTIIELLAYCVAAGTLTVLGDIWITELLYRYRLRERSSWGLANGFSVLDVKNLESRLDQIGRPGIIGQTTRGVLLSGLQAPDIQIVDYTFLVRDYRGGAGGGLSARRATTLVLTELNGRVPPIEVQPRGRTLNPRRLLPRRSKPAGPRSESPESGFDGRFRVISGDGASTAKILAPAARAAMLERPHAGFELGGRYLVADECRLLFGEDLLAAVATVRRLRDALPADEGTAGGQAGASATTIWSRLGLSGLGGESGPWRRPRTGTSG
jgi:hypothetical protein